MTLLELLEDCARKGIVLAPDGDKLLVRAPHGGITPDLQSELQRHKHDILGRLRRSPENFVSPSPAPGHSDVQSLSLAQQSLWFLHQLDPATLPAYNIRKAFVLQGAIDADRWANAFRTVVDRHESLRCTFESIDEHPVVRVAASPAPLEIVDLTHLDAEAQSCETRRRIDQEGRHVFDLATPPLLHASLLRLSAERSLLILNAHHLIADAWSAGIILREVADLYEGRSPRKPALSYRDYVQWQRQRVDAGEIEPHLAYWREKLAGLPQLELPVDHGHGAGTARASETRSPQSPYDGASEPYVLPRDVANAVRAFSAARGVTLFSTFLASFAAVLHRYSGQDDFPIGTSVAGRTRNEFEDIVGLFADLLVLRMDAGGAPSFSDLVDRVQQISGEAFDHQEAPFDEIVKAVRPERVTGRNPLFHVLFLFLQSDPRFGEVQVPSVSAKFDLSLHVEDAGSEIRGLVEYRTALFEPSTIQRFLAAWLELLQAAIADPARKISELPIVTAAARHDLLFARNEVRRSRHPYTTLRDAFDAQVEKTPDRVALKAGDRVLTYRELDQRANRVARALRQRGAGPESRIGLLLERSADMVVAIVGVIKAGAAYVPFDPSDPSARLAFMRKDSGVSLVIDDVERFCAPLPSSSPIDERPLRGSNAAYVIYTSGSTGQPRGVVVSHDNVLRLMASTDAWFGFNEDDVWTLFHSYAFDFSVWEIWGALLYGGRVVVVPQLTSRSPEGFHRLLRDEGVTVLNQTPSAFRSLIGMDVVPSLRYVVFGGEALDLAMLAPWFDRYGDERPCMINMYGITETTVHVTWRRITRADLEAGRGSVIGERIPDLTLYILDDDLQPVPDGVTGQLHVGGAGLSRGYLGRPALTAERFIPDPFSSTPGGRLYRTGDLARWRSGDIEYLGRCDDQVKIRGFRIEPGEIENVLRSHTGVKECVVIARAAENHQQRRLIAYYIPVAASIHPAELRALCEQRLPLHMIPAGFVALDAWPRTRNDKLDKSKLPLPELDSAAAKLAYVAPRTPKERLLADLWSRCLGVGAVGIHDDFFALGGDSILSLDLLSQMRKQGLESSVAQIYQHHTVAELAEVVTSVAPETAGTPPFSLLREDDRARLPRDLEDAYPLSQLQAGMLYEEQLHPDDALYHDIFSFHLRLPFDATAWSGVLQETVDRNAALRTSFDFTHFSEPLQLVRLRAAAKVTVVDLSGLPDEEQERRVEAIVAEERTRRFEHDTPPLLRFYLAKRADDRTQIVFGFHHAILDGWSVAVMFSRLLSAYLAELKLRAAVPADHPPAVRHADYVAEERASLAVDEAFWKSEIAGLPVVRIPREESFLEACADIQPTGDAVIPTRRSRAGESGGGRRGISRTPGRGGDSSPHATASHPPATRAVAPARNDTAVRRTIVTKAVTIPPSISEALVRASRTAGAPLKSTLLAAHLRVIGALTGTSEGMTGVVTNGRPERPGADRVLGLFLNTLPLRVDLTSGTFVELIGRTLHAEQRLLEHRRFPMAAVKRLAGGRTLFDAAFNFVHFHVYQEVMQTAGLEVLGHRVWEETDFPFLAQFSVFPGSSRVELSLIYDSSEFSAGRMESIAGYYVRCLEGIAERPESPVRERSLLSDEERALLDEWRRGSGADELTAQTLHRWFEQQAQRTPNNVALRFERLEVTYRELDARANRLAHHLRSLGVDRETLVGLCLDRSLDLVVAILGILKAGGAYVPLDPSYPVSRLQFIIEDSRAPLVLTHSTHQSLFTETPLVLLDRDAPAIDAQPSTAPSTSSHAGDAAYVIYTSGSTGKPKGVVVTHANVTRLMEATEELFGFGESDVWTLFHSYAFDFSVWEIWGALLYGGRVVVVPYTTSRTPEEFHRLLIEERVTVLNQTPSAFYQLMEQTAPPSLRFVIFGGEALDFPRLRGWFARHGDEHPQLVNMYGITETTVHVTHRRIHAADAERPQSAIGRPLPHVEAMVLDGAMDMVPIGVPGELYVGGAGVSRGYLRRDELTAARFVDTPHGLFYRTGDLVRWLATGELEYLGRIDTQVKVRGFRIELGEIEHVLRCDERIGDAAVVFRDDRLVAYVVARSTVTPAELRRHCEEQLPDYMVPAAYALLDKLPITANGKLDREALPQIDAEALPQVPYVAPRDDIESQLCAIWQQVLDVETIGVHHGFFDLGGHSLHATQLMARVREAFAVDLPLRTLFEQPTVEGLAAVVVAQRERQSGHARITTAPTRSNRRQVRLTDQGELAGPESS